jgi:predicted PurR-regulated permease PerM
LIVSLFFWGLILGPAGALLAVPLTLAAKAVFEAFPDTRWIGTVLSDGEPSSPVGAA